MNEFLLRTNFLFFATFLACSVLRLRGADKWLLHLVLLGLGTYAVCIMPLDWVLRAQGSGRQFMFGVCWLGLAAWPFALGRYAGEENKAAYMGALYGFVAAFALIAVMFKI